MPYKRSRICIVAPFNDIGGVSVAVKHNYLMFHALGFKVKAVPIELLKQTGSILSECDIIQVHGPIPIKGLIRLFFEKPTQNIDTAWMGY